MRDKDSQLIFESYNKNIQLINEAVPLLLITAISAPILAYMSGKSEFTSELLKDIKRSSDGLIDLEAILEHPIGKFLSCFDPTGVTSWPDVEQKIKQYESDPSDENKFELWLSVFSSIPLIGKLRVLKAAWAGKSAIGAAAKNSYIFKGVMYIIEKTLNIVFDKPEFVTGFKKIFKSSPNSMKQLLIAVLGIFGARTLLKHIGANIATTASSDENVDFKKNDAKASPTPYKMKNIEDITVDDLPEGKYVPYSPQASPTPYQFKNKIQ